MIELIQFPWSPFCFVQRFILDYSGAKFRITNLKRPNDRAAIWKLTRGRYYGVPVIRDGRKVIIGDSEETQNLARYLNKKLRLDLFPADREGLQFILSRYIENEIEAVTFRLNDIYHREFVPVDDLALFVRHKERKFGRGCLEHWKTQRQDWLQQLEEKLKPFEQILAHSEYLCGDRPLFVNFCLQGMIANFLFTGHYRLPKSLPHLGRWLKRMEKARKAKPS